MNSKKKAKLPLRSEITKGFQKDWTRLSHSGRYNMADLKTTMLLLIANDGPLPPEYLDHSLTAEWADHRECHVGGDFLLIYRIDDEEVVFVRAGTHSELFK
ncbi:type II toxin-antitoxin system YafQ family toxin [Pandoraea commovens]|uniref:Type II toxin-antitoxin system YafQ family toxin n=1 Tax=Pandoraea commovens TaxID=2508289 RepID=A0ABY5Q925_9BURK|nr:type II toxin-antitoxin system YafQ family toxin [Pandoraea commovens]UVA77134.1 type II toxin-antitoxin system YafQ family toxin [Pandoraea commovens]